MPILEESARIRDALLAVQTDVNAYHETLQRGRLSAIRQELGYPAPELVELSGVVDARIMHKTPVISPEALETVLPVTVASEQTTREARQLIEDVLVGEDDRLIIVMGPCSMHDPEAALEYAEFVKEMRAQYGDDLVILMRHYPEKPRTEKGWKGFIHDPLLDGSDDMNLGLIADRMTALRITGMGVPIARERLGANTPQYVNGLVAYDSIGARNVEDQNARMYGSGTSSPIGFKNATDGSPDAAISACVAANVEHTFVGLSANGQQAVVATRGNSTAHVILRGGKDGPNFDDVSIKEVTEVLRDKNKDTGLSIPEGVVVDASHKNKVDGRQMPAIENVAQQIRGGSVAIKGVMIESNLRAGNQKLDPKHPARLEHGISITDECVDLAETRTMLGMLSAAVQVRREQSS
ncbi:3-deoxy-7-phosphoheptulonate synthase [Patescibacteria group bacterium]|nr:MAG: 3-deoxy-7-phosphoheptulonate synthase [Patescibacteria group bacterium]